MPGTSPAVDHGGDAVGIRRMRRSSGTVTAHKPGTKCLSAMCCIRSLVEVAPVSPLSGSHERVTARFPIRMS